ncbi:MAG: hypothetical protein A3K19_25975 [Lentisphaerae bacterium RIFOXYB12_FULL_65_16]|nr:MAG: hypothetical protein A3K18_25240 [Lentisphaerae bacterium RIFOXYA12_64_32]OGV92618.1 MAG: hypothetical protein A3K19_25975 [Lentisphaerae bacterium RIFOXYB12_FULL_65_16]
MDSGDDVPSRFIVLTHGVPAQEVEVSGEAFTIGRQLDNSFVVGDTQVSKHHCRLFLQDGRWHVEDLGSRNGTFVNGERITAPQALTPGDGVRVGRVTIQVPEQRQSLRREADQRLQGASVTPVPAPPSSAPPIPLTRDGQNEPSASQERTPHTGVPQRVESLDTTLKGSTPREAARREPPHPQGNHLFSGYTRDIPMEKERRQEDAEEGGEEEAKRAEAEREATNTRHAKVKAIRKASGRCVMCGNDLGLLERLSGQDHHAQCTSFIEYKMPPSLGRP